MPVDYGFGTSTDDVESLVSEVAEAETKSTNREAEKDRLIDEVLFLAAQRDAITKCMDDRRAALKLLMDKDGDRARETVGGKAGFFVTDVYTVCDELELVKLFSPAALAGIAKPTKAFVQAAKMNGIAWQKAITVGHDERFKVEAAKKGKALAAREMAIEEAARKIEASVTEYCAKMRSL